MVLEKPVVHVQILRQVTLEIRGQKSWRNFVLGEGTLTAVPPPPATSSLPPSHTDDVHLDWTGDVLCDESVTVGGFIVGNAQVKV